ncbi:hypothetical protein CCYA_CCYA20G4794 [Cyanidiococcus yangmingshanensis]|nr:hypothetical protein CCYA_CCYA20G4794 [Cyanidiococcus yangmingshanensis]
MFSFVNYTLTASVRCQQSNLRKQNLCRSGSHGHSFGASWESDFKRNCVSNKQLGVNGVRGVRAMKALFWFFRRAPKDVSTSRRRRIDTGSEDGSNPYRALGVSESATFEEIQAAFENLKIKYADDMKQLTKLEVLRDKIFDDKLRRRLQGKLQGIVRESPLEKRFRQQPWWKTTWIGQQITTPGGLLHGIFKVPDMKYFRRTTIIMGILAILGLLVPRFATSALPIACMTSMAFLYNRGQPEVRRDEFGNIGEVRPLDRPAALKAIGIVLILGGLGFVFAYGIVSFLNLEQAIATGFVPEWLQPAGVVSALVTLGMWFACTFFQVQPSQRA